jgi:hypothetical protein
MQQTYHVNLVVPVAHDWLHFFCSEKPVTMKAIGYNHFENVHRNNMAKLGDIQEEGIWVWSVY